VDLAGNNGNSFVIFMSDHGFQANKYTFHINNWLSQNGFLKTKIVMAHFLMKKLRYVYKKTRLGASKNTLKKRIKNIEQSFSIDWGKSIGYAVANNSYAQIFLREGLRESDKINLIDTLMSIKGPDNINFFETYYTKYDLYGEVANECMPDLIFIPKNGNSCLSTFDGKDIFSTRIYPEDYQVGYHHPEGIFVISGENIPIQEKLRAHIIDIFPTVVYMMGLKIPSYIDGKVIIDVFPMQFLNQHEILFSNDISEKKNEDFKYEKEDKEKVEKSLKDLGYF
jgi:predicted AlkP superfamily phosphohydrolase/phosphomutase